MGNRVFAIGCGLIAAFLAAAGVSPAADFSMFVGGVLPGSVEYRDQETGLDNGPLFGFRLRTNFVPNFGMEHTLAFSSDYAFPTNASVISDAKGIVYNSNLILDFPLKIKKAVPFLTAGAGFVRQYGDSPLPVGTRFAVNYGGGLKFPRLYGPLGLRCDLRGYRAGGVSNTVNMLEISGGMLISFGH